MNKRAALELSINAIVIIVIAMAVLGLSLGFVRSQLKKISETSLTVQEQAKQGILEDLRGAGGKKLSFPLDRITLGPGDKKDFAIGIQNLGDAPANFSFNISQYNTSATPPKFETVAYGSSAGQFQWDRTTQLLAARDVKVLGILYVGASISTDYMYKITVYRQDGAAWTEYDSKTFFVTIG
jgi:hypothetical protein